MPPERRNAFQLDSSIAYEHYRNRVVPATKRSRDRGWDIWCQFCQDHNQDPYLTGVEDRTTYFLVFAMRVRDGSLARNKGNKPVKIGAVEEALRAAAEGFTLLGLPDPRFIPGSDRLLPLIAGLYAYFRKEDPSPDRVWPVNVTILRAMEELVPTYLSESYIQAVLDLSILAFYFLCRPGEYAESATTDEGRSKPFTLNDVHFNTPTRQRVSAATASLNDLEEGIYVSLTFTDQKNAVRGEAIGQRENDDPILCPVKAVLRRVAHLRQHNAPATTPLFTYYTRGEARTIQTKHICKELRHAAAQVQHITGIPPEKLQAYSLRSGGATALLCAKVDPTVIALTGRWKSDAMLRYLRTQAMPVTASYSQDMLVAGQYTFAPTRRTQELLPREVDPAVVNLLAQEVQNTRIHS